MYKSNIKIVVVTHKEYTMPEDTELYLPVQSGAAIWPSLNIQRDDEGEQISEKNLAYNELCPMYWAWKNLRADYIGLCHYRRLFSDTKRNGISYQDILTMKTAQKLCSEHDIILPPVKRYYCSTVAKHYIHSMKEYDDIHARDIQTLRTAILHVAPDYLIAFDHVMNNDSAHMLHMCLMKRKYYDEYCSFMFRVMFQTEKLLQDRPDQNRYIGALSEFLLDVWIKKNKLRYYELGLVELEHEGYIKKIQRVLKRRLLKGK